MYLIEPSTIPAAIADEGLDVWLCSYGGSGTNMLASYLETKSLVVRTRSWKRLLCHHSQPIDVRSPTKAVYLFGDPRAAFKSMKRRGPGHYDVNQQKLNNRKELPYSDETLMSSMLRQFDRWTARNQTNLPILLLRFEHIFESGKYALARFLGIDVSDFPDRKPTRDSEDYSFEGEEQLFRRYAPRIERILAFPSHADRPPSLSRIARARFERWLYRRSSAH